MWMKTNKNQIKSNIIKEDTYYEKKTFCSINGSSYGNQLFAGTAFASDSEPVTIKVTRACFNLANPDSEQVKKVQDAINEYIKDKINVQIELTDIGSGEYTEKANLALANNEITCFGQLHGNLPLEQMI